MHVRYCECDDCLPGFPAQPTAITFTGRRRRWASAKERRKAENARHYMKRKLQGKL